MGEAKRYCLLASVALTLAISAAILAFYQSGSASAAVGTDAVGERIDRAFALLSDNVIGSSSTLGRVSRGRCDGATWPDIDIRCLSRLDGSPVGAVRVVAIVY